MLIDRQVVLPLLHCKRPKRFYSVWDVVFVFLCWRTSLDCASFLFSCREELCDESRGNAATAYMTPYSQLFIN